MFSGWDDIRENTISQVLHISTCLTDIEFRTIIPGHCKLPPPPLKTVRLFFGKSWDLENSAVRLFFGEISANLSERLFTIFF